MTHLEEINDIWYAYEHNKCEVGELIRDALDLQQNTLITRNVFRRHL